MEIAERLGDGSTTWMSTIYRTLELLEAKEIVTRTTLMGSDMAYYEITPHTTPPLCSVYKMWSHDTSAHLPCCRNTTGIN